MEERSEHSEHHHHHHKHHHHHRRHDDSEKAYIVFLGRRMIKRSYLYKCTAVAIVIAVLAAAAVFGISRWENKRFSNPVADEPKVDPELILRKTVEIDGVTYRQRGGLDTYLIIGVDTTGEITEGRRRSGGQGDVQFVLVLDHRADTWQILQLNRDTMTDIPILGMTGKVIGTEREQLALAYAYGTGREDSCRNNIRAVSAMLWDQDFTGYAAMNMEGIAILNDALGGVEVTIHSNFSKVDPSLKMGETIRLMGTQAETFVRARGGVDDETNLSRMERQKQYLEGARVQMKLLSQDELVEAFGAVRPYMVTSLNDLAAAGIAEKLQMYEMRPMLTVDGTTSLVDGYAAFEMDQSSLQKVILELFYEPIS